MPLPTSSPEDVTVPEEAASLGPKEPPWVPALYRWMVPSYPTPALGWWTQNEHLACGTVLE